MLLANRWTLLDINILDSKETFIFLNEVDLYVQ